MHPQPNILQVSNLTKSFTVKGKVVHAIHGISLSVPAGSIYGMMGMSGAGKTTLLRCLVGLERPTEGTILFEGEEISQKSAAELRQYRSHIGMIFQHFQLLSSRNVTDNVAFPLELFGVSKEIIKNRVAELLELVQLSHKKEAYPSQLSGGEKQRVGIARALANNPKLLLCDEATSALDPKSTQGILQLLQKLNQDLNLTIILITHQLETIKQICSRAAVLSKGTIVEEGEVRELFIRPQDPMTRQLLHLSNEDIHPDLLVKREPGCKLVRLGFEGKTAKEPVISRLIRNYDLEVNILSGGLDYLRQTVIGHLLVEIRGSRDSLEKGFSYLQSQNIVVEEIQ